MATPEDEIKNLRENNSELVQKVQYWKMTAAQRENEKLELMKEINELRLQLSRIRSGGAAHARKLNAALQAASEEALSHLVQASEAVARTIELAKTYMNDRQELENANPRCSNISGNSNTERVHKVRPMMFGQIITQPVISLRRTVLNTSNPRAASRSRNQNGSFTDRAVPMHMLQDLYIPLTRVDANELPGNNAETDDASNIEDSIEDLDLEDSTNDRTLEESQNVTEEDFDASRRLDAVNEDLEPEDEVATPPPRSRTENPLEGPSWLLDVPTNTKTKTVGGRSTLEPDSTTELEERRASPPPPAACARTDDLESAAVACEFTPTVRRRKRPPSPPSPAPAQSPVFTPQSPVFTPHSPRLHQRRAIGGGRVLKVLVTKMQLEGCPGRGGGGGVGVGVGVGVGGGGEGSSPPKRASAAPHGTPTRATLMRFDAPSPNGATDAGVIVSEAIEPTDVSITRDDVTHARGDSAVSRGVSAASRDSRDSDHELEGRTRRPRKQVTYKEKPLNRKMRR